MCCCDVPDKYGNFPNNHKNWVLTTYPATFSFLGK